MYDSLPKANAKISDLMDKLNLILTINEGLVLENKKLKQQIKELVAKNEQQSQIIKKQAARIDELERRRGMDSTNSGTPPSKDRLGKPRKPKNNRENTGNSSGGQPGHPGNTLKFSVIADEEIEHKPTKCDSCGVSLISGFYHSETRQVHDIEILKKVTNHFLFATKCSCGCTVRANPASAAGVSYGSYLKSALTYLNNYMLIPNECLAKLSAELFKSPISEGSIHNWQQTLGTKLDGYHEDVKFNC